ncbi:MAG: DUF4003 domain-containing protein [Clostridiales bacterium]|nr:DUF4003 domain-containing protein [Clostridiales bacterium]
MKPELEKICADYIANRDTVKKAFRFNDAAIWSVCANLFCACGHTADAEHLKECRKILKKYTRPFSKFRGKVRPFLTCMLAVGNSPEERMALANDYFRLLKRNFKKSEYLVLAAFLLTDLADRSLTEEKAARGKDIYRRMNKKHRLLTNKTDSVFAMLMAYSDKTDDELLEDMDACYDALKAKFSGGSGVQTAAQVLSAAAGTPEEKAQRVIDLFNALEEAEVKYGRSDELAPLAALSLADAPAAALAEDVKAADEFLEEQKLWKSGDKEKTERAMHALMIVSGLYADTDRVNITVMTNTLDMLFAKQQASRFSFAVQVIQALLLYAVGSKDKAEEKAADSKQEETETAPGSTDAAPAETDAGRQPEK